MYVREELADASNNLRVTVHRLKKIIVEAGLPADEYIHIKKGIYSWQAPMRVEVDVKRFVSLYKESKECTDKERKEELLTQVCQMYHGGIPSGIVRGRMGASGKYSVQKDLQ